MNALLRYHGVWGPGVRLLQNLRFGNKALLLVVCLILPMGYLINAQWQRHRLAVVTMSEAEEGMTQYRLVMAEFDALGQLGKALFAQEQQRPDAAQAVARAREAEARSHAALAGALQGEAELSAPEREALGLIARSRERLFNAGDEAQASPPGTQPRIFQALTLLEQQIDTLRMAVLREHGAGLHEDQEMYALVRGGMEPLPPLVQVLRQARRVSQRVLLEDARAAHAQRLMEMAIGLRLTVDGMQRDLQPLFAQGVLDAAGARHALEQISAQASLLRKLALLGGNPVVNGSRASLQAALALDETALQASAEAAEHAATALHDEVLRAAMTGLARRTESRQQEFVTAMTLTLLGTGLMVYLLVCLNKVVGGGLRELAARVDALARGDLTEKPEARGTDEVGQAMTALANSIRRMSTLFEAVTQGVAAVSHASREVALGNAGLTGRTGDIQRSIGDVGERARGSMSAMNRCGDEVERIAGHMRDMRADAQRSRKAMNELQERMRSLQAKSREIGRVVMLVESVAHQTRLLSLNASVEAARAGAAGKGFAVVAQEVRDLARRSESAANKISEIVKASVDEIEAGGLLTERVGAGVRATDERVAEVSAIMGDIVNLTHAGRDQSQEVVGITRSVEESAGGNLRMVEQLTHASDDLRVQGDNLKRSMQHFVFG